MFVHGHLALFVVFIHGRSSSYVHGRFRTCTVVFERMWVSGVVGVDVLWLLRTVVVVVVVVWSLWTHHGWGHRGHMLIGVVVVVVIVATVVVVGCVLILIHHCCWWAMGGHCQSCDGRMGAELTHDGDDACC